MARIKTLAVILIALYSQLCFGQDNIFSNGFERGVFADLKSLTRVEGISPETFYFSAEDSICTDCDDMFGLDTAVADAYSELAYHFNFDDSDSGVFATTNNSRNTQVGGSPRAMHTFECSGPGDVNWQANVERCVFNVGVRVENKNGEFDDAFLIINIAPLYGVGGYYPSENIFCVSSDSDFSACPHNDSSRHLTDTPAINNWHESLVLFQNGSAGVYSRICMGADEQNATAATYDQGTRPVVSFITLSSRPGNCNNNYNSDESIAVLSDNHPRRVDGHLVDGFAFNQTVTGLKVGGVQNGNSFTLLNFHDLDMDWSSDGQFSGEFTMASNPFGCRKNQNLSCSNVPYPMFLFLTDTIISSRADNLATPVNLGCFNGCSAVNFALAGVEVNRGQEHNFRMQGAWGLLLSNNWFRSNHIGGLGGKARVTIRTSDTDALNDLDKNPEDLTGSDYLRGNTAVEDFFNRYNTAVDNRINQAVNEPDHQSSTWLDLSGHFTVIDGNEFIDDGGLSGAQSTIHRGRWRVVRNSIWAPNADADCGFASNYVGQPLYNNASDVYFEGNPNCNTNGAADFNYNIQTLAIPLMPGG